MEYLFSWENWIYLGVTLLIIEVFTPTFVIACIGFGAFAGGIVAYFDASISMQLLMFSIITIIVFLGVRPYALRFLYKSKENALTNADTLIGEVAIVKETIDHNINKGRITIYGDNWRARSTDGETIVEGEIVEVVSIVSTILMVKIKKQ